MKKEDIESNPILKMLAPISTSANQLITTLKKYV